METMIMMMMRQAMHRIFHHTQQEPPLGLDIGSDSLAFVELEGGADPALRAYAQATWNQAGEEKQTENQALSNRIRSVWRQLNTRNHRVSIALPPARTLFQIVEAPLLTGFAMDDLLEEEAATLLGLPAEKISIDYLALPVTEESEASETCRILLCAARLDDILQRRQLVENAGLQLARISIEALSLLASTVTQAEWTGADYVPRALLHAATGSIQCYRLAAGTDFPDPASQHYADFTVCLRDIITMQAQVILFSGPADLKRELEQAVQQHARPPVILSAPFGTISLPGDMNRYILQAQGSALTLAYGLACRG